MQSDGMGWNQAKPASEFFDSRGQREELAGGINRARSAAFPWMTQNWVGGSPRAAGGCNGRVSLFHILPLFHGSLPGLHLTTLLCQPCVNNHTCSLSLLPTLSLLSPTVVVLLAKAAQWADRPAH